MCDLELFKEDVVIEVDMLLVLLATGILCTVRVILLCSVYGKGDIAPAKNDNKYLDSALVSHLKACGTRYIGPESHVGNVTHLGSQCHSRNR